jgi:ribosomal protein L11 methyltransferase
LTPLWTVEVGPVPAAVADGYARALSAACSVVVEGIEASGIRLTGWLAEPPAADGRLPPALTAGLALAAAAAGTPPPPVRLVPVPVRDWLAENRQRFRPFRLGPFFLRGSDDAAPVQPGLIPLVVDAGTAFGSGRHASTAGCLLALADRRVGRPGASVLDVGSGSGVLAIAAAKRWRARVLAADIDPLAVAVARANARLNGVAGRVRTLHADGTGHPLIRAERPYDLILANILARPLIRLASDLAAVSGPGTRLVLGGFVATDAARVAHAHAGHGFGPLARIDRDGWTTLVLERRR